MTRGSTGRTLGGGVLEVCPLLINAEDFAGGLNHPVTFEAYQSCSAQLATRTHKAKMTPKRKLEREAHQLSESIQATCRMLDSRTLPDASRRRLRNEVDLRTAARKSILKYLWVSPRSSAAEQR